MNKLTFFLMSFCLCLNSVYAQDSDEIQIRKVFQDLVNAYGNPKSEPLLEIQQTQQRSPAVYIASPSPKIILDRNFYEICKSFGKDSLNAFSIVLSHELAHYYSDHTFCTDFAYVLRNDDKELSQKLKNFSKSQMMVLETEADNKAIFYSAMAGYDPFKIHEALLDKIYAEYNLPDNIEGYPTKTERKKIYQQTTANAEKLYHNFLQGLAFLKSGEYDKSIQEFEKLNRHFPSRENYNNLGVAKAYKVLENKPLTRNEYLYPEKFTYPFSIDSISYLQKSAERSYQNSIELETLLKSAQKDFEKAISLDPDYVKSYVNLACVYDLLSNPEAAIGKLKELNAENQKLPDVKKIMAIAYYNMGMETKAQELWGE